MSSAREPAESTSRTKPFEAEPADDGSAVPARTSSLLTGAAPALPTPTLPLLLLVMLLPASGAVHCDRASRGVSRQSASSARAAAAGLSTPFIVRLVPIMFLS